ncbi:MAG TPA: hypothetical protein PLY09_00610 [Methanothrix sp.]|nr:hypothetical protein [Methanothrix sp.]HPJ83244.1 hypothetical protein [Methanothrix sp.]
MLAAAFVAFAGCAEKSTEEKAAASGTEAGAEGFSNETAVNESCEDEFTKFTVCPADEIEPKLDSKGEPSPG